MTLTRIRLSVWRLNAPYDAPRFLTLKHVRGHRRVMVLMHLMALRAF